MQCKIDVVGPFGLKLLYLLRCGFVETHTAAFSKAAVIQRKDIDSGSRQLLRQSVPNLSLAVALMQEQNSGSGLVSAEVCCFELRTVLRGEVNNALRCEYSRGNYGCKE